MLTVQRSHDHTKGARRRGHRRHDTRSLGTRDPDVDGLGTESPHAGPGDQATRHDDRLLWLSIACIAGIDGGVLAGLLTAVAGGTKQAALATGGAAALGTFGTVLAVIRFLHEPPEH